jgi:hypothetical protein
MEQFLNELKSHLNPKPKFSFFATISDLIMFPDQDLRKKAKKRL